MRIRPGRTLLAAGGFLFAWGLVGAAWPPALALLPVLLAIIVGGIIVDFIDLRRSLRSIEARREIPERAGRDIPFTVTLCLKHPLGRALAGTLRDVLPDSAEPRLFREAVVLAPAIETRIAYTVAFPERGRYTIGPAWLRLRSRFDWLEGQRELGLAQPVRVLPESAVVQGELEKKALAEVVMLMRESRTRLRGEGLEFESLAEYRPGDDLRRVDWRSSARHTHLVVRRYQVEQHRDLMILIDCGRLMGADTGRGSKLDRAVDAALMLARVATKKGDRCGLGVFDDAVQGFLPPVSGPSAMPLISEALYDVRSQWREANFRAMFSTLQLRMRKRALIVILSDLVDAETSEQYRAAIHSLARRHLLIFVALRTPLLDALARGEVAGTLDVARKAVTMRLLRERERALETLSRGSIHVLDVEPRDITVPLINRYVALRESNRL